MKKEISDTISSRTFLLTFSALFGMMIMGGVGSWVDYQNVDLWRRDELLIIQVLNPTVKWVGALVALTLGFNTIRRESSEGSLKVLLSYPIYRDQVILGKFLGNLLVLIVAVASSMAASFSLYIYLSGFTPEPSSLVNYSTFVTLSILFLAGYLGLSIMLSLAFKDVKITLLVLFFLLVVFNSETFSSLGLMLSNAVYGASPRIFDLLKASALSYQPGDLAQMMYDIPSQNPQAQALQSFFAGLSPARGFTSTSMALMPSYRGILVNKITHVFWWTDISIRVTWWDIVVNNLYSITALVLLPIISFTGSYILFVRRDVA